MSINPVKSIRQSLARRICFGFLAFVLVGFLVVLGYIFTHSRRMVLQEAYQHGEFALGHTAQRVKGYLNEVEDATHNMKWVVLSHMQPDSKIHEQFDKAFTHAAGIYYQKAFDTGINQLYTDIKMFDENAVKKFNETCLDGMFKQIFENLKNNKMSDNEVINLATHGGVIASNSGVKPEDALNHFVIKHPGLVPENIINQVKDGFIHKPLKNEGPQAGPVKEGQKQGNLEVNPHPVKLPGM